ncbi:NAD-dependent malic enzyme, partial [Mammaliicoccus sciuri]|nr:NAD-dependent malic enzyme [Mammaliicoccus sciuri]
PGPFDPRVAPYVAKAVAKAGMESGVARIEVDVDEIERRTYELADLS